MDLVKIHLLTKIYEEYLVLNGTKEFSNVGNNFLGYMHADEKNICPMFSMFLISHNECVTNSNGCFIENFILNVESFRTHINVKKSSVMFQLSLTFVPKIM